MSIQTKAGYVAIVGRPNVGKSTLMNHIIGQKISITSHKPQTTRHAITGIYTNDTLQIVFLDTPGLHLAQRSALNQQLNRTAQAALLTAQVVVHVIEADKWTPEDEWVIQQLKQVQAPIIAVINKIDLISDKARLLPVLSAVNERFPYTECVPLSAKHSKSAEVLLPVLEKYLPESEFLYDEEEITTASRAFLAAETLREKLTRRLNQELPYALSVEIESFTIKNAMYHIHALVWVERDSQKAIVIGHQGQVLKQAGTEARIALEALYGVKVFLKVWVKVRQGWSDDEKALNALGYKALE